MFGMLMRSLGSPPFPLFRPAPLAHTLFPQFFETFRAVCVYIYVVPPLFERDSNVFSNVFFDRRLTFASLVSYHLTFTTKSIDLLGIGDPRSTRCSHYSSIVTSRFIASMIYTRLGQTIYNRRCFCEIYPIRAISVRFVSIHVLFHLGYAPSVFRVSLFRERKFISLKEKEKRRGGGNNGCSILNLARRLSRLSYH